MNRRIKLETSAAAIRSDMHDTVLGLSSIDMSLTIATATRRATSLSLTHLTQLLRSLSVQGKSFGSKPEDSLSATHEIVSWLRSISERADVLSAAAVNTARVSKLRQPRISSSWSLERS